ncbi:TPA: restriction endonuclease subunit S [Vibrio cholerae]|nr:restriction endonuclease subunit S [Vibrio cholerae]EHP5028455.1 restriction endonuclease subunit S [Vibrio cholerae]HDI3208917.1 restriction endonuclease subunit S [Vibrio cholerae]HDI3222090.1 restriction endonuclease subunit S [Vibrio cholerae]
MVKLKDCCTVVGGATPKRNIPEYWDSKDVPWVTPKDISKLSNKVLNDAPEYISQLGFDKCATSLLPKGAVLLTSRAPIGNVAIAGRDMCTNQGFKSLVPSDRVDSTYLYYCMLWHSSMLEALGNGATFKEVSKKIVEEFEIPLPPLDEQKRIAAILDKADAIHQKRKQVIALADEFLRSVFLEMFGDPVTNPKGWSRKEIKEGVSRITSGWSAKGDSRPCGQGEVGVLKISAVTSGEFKPKENKFVEKHIIPEGKNLIFPKKGDLLFSRANTRELVAATCIVPKDCDDVFLPDKLWNIELSSEELMPEYFHMLLQDDKFKETLTSQATGSSGSMLNISKQKFETTLAPFAPIDLQMKFKNIYWQLKDNAAKMKNSEDYLIEQFNALSQKAFSGQL